MQEEVEASSSSEGSSENSSTADSSLEDSISESDHQSNPLQIRRLKKPGQLQEAQLKTREK